MNENNMNYGASADVIYPSRFNTAKSRLAALINSRMPSQQAARVMELLTKIRECMGGLADACELQASRVSLQGETVDVARVYADLSFMATACRQNEGSLAIVMNAISPLQGALAEVSSYVQTDQPQPVA